MAEGRITKDGKTVVEGASPLTFAGEQPNTDVPAGKYKLQLTQGGEPYGEIVDITGFKTKALAVTGVSLNKTTLALKTGTSETLVATVAPSNATNKGVEWSSGDAKIATVDSAGKVTAVANGSADITVKTKDGGKTAVCKATVKTPEPEEPPAEG